MCGQPYLDTMHADCANLIMRYLSIRWSDLETEYTIATVRISRSFLWYAMNELKHVMQKKLIRVMQEQIDACNAIMIFRVHEWSFKSFPLIKSWVQNQVSALGYHHSPYNLFFNSNVMTNKWNLGLSHAHTLNSSKAMNMQLIDNMLDDVTWILATIV